MPNKRKLAKLRTKLLVSGKLNENKSVKETFKQLEKKAQIDNEGINYDYEKDLNKDFERIHEGERVNKKNMKLNMAKPFGYTNNSKRKAADTESADVEPKKAKKQKIKNESKAVVVKLDNLPKNSKKNKYFFMAHPEMLKDKETISKNTEFVIDEEKMKLNELKKKKKKTAVDKQDSISIPVKKEKKFKNKLKTKSNNLWIVDECGSSDEDTDVAAATNQDSADKSTKMLDLSSVEKNFIIKESFEKLEDGTVIKVFKPEIVEGSDNEEVEPEIDENIDEVEQESTKIEVEQSKNSKSQNPLMEKLQSSRFRYLNELYYTHSSDKSFEYFQKDEDAFKAYHEGFKNQTAKWPLNPLDEIIKYIKSRSSNLIVADFGCGEAKLAQQVPNKCHSFDFVALNDLVTKCDMKNVPLNPQSCDIVVFCLSLMGTNVVDFLCEAHRVLKQRGVLKIAEVVSRIENKQQFIRDIESIGFKLVSENKNKKEEKDEKKGEYFYFFDFVKMSTTVKSKPNIKLTACLYKKR